MLSVEVDVVAIFDHRSFDSKTRGQGSVSIVAAERKKTILCGHMKRFEHCVRDVCHEVGVYEPTLNGSENPRRECTSHTPEALLAWNHVAYVTSFYGALHLQTSSTCESL